MQGGGRIGSERVRVDRRRMLTGLTGSLAAVGLSHQALATETGADSWLNRQFADPVPTGPVQPTPHVVQSRTLTPPQFDQLRRGFFFRVFVAFPNRG